MSLISVGEGNSSKSNWIRNALLVGMILSSLATGLVPQTLLSIMILGISLLLVCRNEAHLAYPVMLFYYSYLGTVMGVSVYRLYSLAFLVLMGITNRKNLRVERTYGIVFFVFAIYTFGVIMPYSIQLGIFNLVDVVFSIAVAYWLRDDKKRLREFFSVYTITALCSFITGVVNGNNMGVQDVYNDEFVQMSRYQATFEDPNYMGFFFTLAVFSVITLKLFKPKLRIAIVIVLYAMMLTSLSVTAIIVNAVLWIAYLAIRGRISAKTMIGIVLSIATVIGLYQYGLENRDTPVLGNICYRIEQKLGYAEVGDYNEVTTKRLSLTEGHLEYYETQPIFKQLFGGNLITSSMIDLPGDIAYSAHNEYVDELLNVGLIGEIILMGFSLSRIFHCFRRYRGMQSEQALCALMGKITWHLYITSLTVFMDFKFMLMYFL